MTATTSPDTDNIIRKIEKCLALSRSSNEHEAAAALRQANKLMAAYNITAEALTGAQIGTFKAKTDSWTRPPAWEMHLIGAIKRAFGCDAILNIGYGGYRDRSKNTLTTVEYIGVKYQAELAAYTHEVMRKQVERARAKYTAGLEGYRRGEKMAAGETFCQEYVGAVSTQIIELAVPEEQEVAIKATRDKLLGNNPKPFKATARGYNWDAADAGAAAGKGASLHRPVNGREQLKLGK